MILDNLDPHDNEFDRNAMSDFDDILDDYEISEDDWEDEEEEEEPHSCGNCMQCLGLSNGDFFF